MMLNSRDFFFIFIIYLLFHNNNNTLFRSAQNLVKEAKECDPKSCGNGLNISYPFFLHGHQPSYCGYPLLNLTCNETNTNNSPPVLNILGQDLYIKDIFYDNQSFVLTAAEFADAPCLIPYENFTVTDTYPLSISNTNDIVFFLLNCSHALTGYESISCGVNGHLDYYGGVYDNKSEVEGCQLVTMPVVRNDEVKGEEFVGLLRSGWVMEWSFPPCAECQESGGTCGYNETESNFMCICSDITHKVSCKAPTLKKRTKMKLMGFAIGVVAASGIFILVHLVHYRVYWMKRSKQSADDFLKNYGPIALKRYRYSEIKRITKSFNKKLGEGGYGSVFLGTLQDGQLVAVKLITKTTSDGEEFINEVASISRTSHVNVVCLLGYCLEKSKRALVYDYMPNGSPDKYIYGDKPKLETELSWQKLYEISIGIARGLEYLHRGCNTRIVHFDIKPHNILLDKNFNPKISDFGLAKLVHQNMSKISMVGARGTVGYIAPNFVSRSFGEVTSKSDVYNFGMMVLKMVAGRKNFDGTVDKYSEIYFPHWIHDHLDQYCKSNVFVLSIETEVLARKMIIVSLWCIQIKPANRPSMSMVVDMLEGNIDDIQMPPKQNLI